VSTTRKALRQDIIRRLYSPKYPAASESTADGSTTTILDSLLSPSAQSEDFIRAWIYIRSQPTAIDSTSTVTGAHNTTTTNLVVSASGVFTVGDGIQVTVATVTETMRVTVIVDGTNLTVVRGIQDSTAVTMAGGEAINIVGPAIGEATRVTNVDFSGATSTLTLAPALSAATVNEMEYEIHYVFHPEDVNDSINDVIHSGSRGALDALTTDAGTTTFEAAVLLAGVLATLKRGLAARGIDSERYINEARQYEDEYLDGLVRLGYREARQYEDEDLPRRPREGGR